MDKTYLEKNILEVFYTTQVEKLKYKWNDPQNFSVMADIPNPKYIPQLEKMIINVLHGSSYYYKSVKRNYGKNYVFRIALRGGSKNE